MLLEETVIAHDSCEYKGDDPKGEGVWIGWDAQADDVVSDMDIHALFVTPVMPEVLPEKYDFLYSDDEADDSAYTLAEFVGILQSGQARTWFQVGDRIKMVTPTDVFADSTIELMVLGFNHYRLAEEGTFAGVVFGMAGVMNAKHAMNSGRTNTGGWPASEMRAFLNDTIFPALPQHWRVLMETVTVLSSAGDTSAEIVSAQDKLFLRAYVEMSNTTSVPYCNEVDQEAEEATFAVYTDSASRVLRLYNGLGDATACWLRSPGAEISFWLVHPGGNVHANSTGYPAIGAHGVSWLCCMGVTAV